MSRVLTLKDYCTLINLQPNSFKSGENNINYDAIIRQIAQYLSGPTNPHSHRSTEEQRAFIRHILTIRDPALDHRYSPHIYDLIDQMLVYERDHMKTLTQAIHLPVQFKSFPYIRV